MQVVVSDEILNERPLSNTWWKLLYDNNLTNINPEIKYENSKLSSEDIVKFLRNPLEYTKEQIIEAYFTAENFLGFDFRSKDYTDEVKNIQDAYFNLTSYWFSEIEETYKNSYYFAKQHKYFEHQITIFGFAPIIYQLYHIKKDYPQEYMDYKKIEKEEKFNLICKKYNIECNKLQRPRRTTVEYAFDKIATSECKMQ